MIEALVIEEFGECLETAYSTFPVFDFCWGSILPKFCLMLFFSESDPSGCVWFLGRIKRKAAKGTIRIQFCLINCFNVTLENG